MRYENGVNMSDRKYPKRDLVKAVSEHTNIRADIVEIILDGFVDVAVEDLMNKGEFSLQSLFNVKSHDWGEYTFGDGQVSPPKKRLKIRLAHKLHELWKIKEKFFKDSPYAINRHNWKDIYRDYSTKRAKKVDKKESEELGYENPFLQDDNDYQ